MQTEDQLREKMAEAAAIENKGKHLGLTYWNTKHNRNGEFRAPKVWSQEEIDEVLELHSEGRSVNFISTLLRRNHHRIKRIITEAADA